MSKKMKVLLLFGGKSAEHDISVQSAQTIAKAFAEKKFTVIPVYIQRGGKWIRTTVKGLLSGRPAAAEENIPSTIYRLPSAFFAVDVVFPALHGPMGEDGTVQGMLELAGLPYVGCGVLSSAVCMDKEVTKRLAALEGIPVLPHVLLHDRRDIDSPECLRRCERLGFPLFVKPACLGSSVGVTKVHCAKELKKAVLSAFKYGTKTLVEKGVDKAREIVCAILGGGGEIKASACGEILPKGKHEFFDYDAKYLDPEGYKFVLPAVIPAKISEAVREMSIKAFKAVEGYGMARVDFLVDSQNRFYFCEINTIPGFTSHSLYPRLWAHSGVPLSELLDKLVCLALKRKSGQEKLLVIR